MANRNNSKRRTYLALGLITVGLLALLGIGRMWPLLILLPGMLILLPAIRGGRTTAALAIPGMVIAGTGGLLFFQNLTGYWESWAYAWALYGVFLGLGIMLMGSKLDDRSIITFGRFIVWLGIAAFVGAAFLAEIVLGIGILGSGLGALALIALGVFLLMRGRQDRRSSHRPERPSSRADVPSQKQPDISRLSVPDNKPPHDR